MHTISIIISSGIIVVVVAITVIITLITIISTNIIIATVAPFLAPAPEAGNANLLGFSLPMWQSMTDADFVRSLDKTDAGRAAPLPRAPGRTTDEGKSSSDQGAAAAPPPARAGAASAAGAEGASTIAGASQPGAAVELVLTWPCGAVIHRFDKVPYDSVEEFVQRMEEGYFEHIGIPRCADSHYSRWLAHYDIVHEDQVLRCGLRFSDLDLPPGAHMKLVRTDIAVPAAGPGVGGTPGQLPPQAQAASTIAGASRPGAAVDPGVSDTFGQPLQAQTASSNAGAPQPGVGTMHCPGHRV